MDERRKFARLSADVEVVWKKRIQPPGSAFETKNTTRNISAGGICLIVYEKVNENDILELEIRLPTGNAIRALGKAVWVSEYEIVGEATGNSYDIGVEFIDIADDEREEINKFVFRGIQRLRHP